MLSVPYKLRYDPWCTWYACKTAEKRNSKGILADILQICELNCYQTNSLPLGLSRCLVTRIKKLKFNSYGKPLKKKSFIWNVYRERGVFENRGWGNKISHNSAFVVYVCICNIPL